jgi:hypothetical protein
MRSRQNTGILKALAAALLLHALVLLLPLTRPAPPAIDSTGSIELELVTYLPPPPIAEAVPEPMEIPETRPAPLPDVDDSIAPPPTEPQLDEPEPATVIVQQAVPEQITADPAAVILSRQFITETSEADRLFGRPLVIEDPAAQQGFRFPVRQDLLDMLDKPMQDLPFAYTPGLVHFAYDPGVRGDMQRFLDAITPEFGWRTDNGTEFRCILLLVVVGCGWK